MSKQPVWKFVVNLGDADPIEHGGLFVYIDETGVYPPEMERLERDGAKFEVHRVLLEKCAVVAGRVIHDVDFARADPERYEEWFSKDLARVAETMGTTLDKLHDELCSDDPTVRARAYRDVYDFHGWANGDEYPLQLTRAEVEARYAQGECA